MQSVVGILKKLSLFTTSWSLLTMTYTAARWYVHYYLPTEVHAAFGTLPNLLPFKNLQIIIPAFIKDVWCSYMFDIPGTKIHILDPCHCSARLPLHSHFKNVIHKSLARCIDAYFDGWVLKPIDQWDVHYPKLCDDTITRLGDGLRRYIFICALSIVHKCLIQTSLQFDLVTAQNLDSL